MSHSLKIVIPRGDTPRALYSEEAQALLAPLGEVQIRRASHVEPTDGLSTKAIAWLLAYRAALPPNMWWADLTPVDGPILGPFHTRATALTEEIVWLDMHGFPFATR